VVQACLLMLAMAVMLGTLLGDLLQAAMDPRVRAALAMIAPPTSALRPRAAPGALAGLWLALVVLPRYLCAAGSRPMPMTSRTCRTPTSRHRPRTWLGTDEFGRDLLTRMIYGARTSLSVSATAIGISVLCGMVLGAPPAGYFGGWFDRIVTVVVDLTWSFPEILIALILVAIIGPGTTGTMAPSRSPTWRSSPG
jgi:peptide/nickel transport system permease protein